MVFPTVLTTTLASHYIKTIKPPLEINQSEVTTKILSIIEQAIKSTTIIIVLLSKLRASSLKKMNYARILLKKYTSIRQQ